MKTSWQDANGAERKMVAPVSLIVSAFAPVREVRRTWTPQLRTDRGDSVLLLVDLGAGRDRLGASSLAQVYGKLAMTAPDCDDPQVLANFFAAMVELRAAGLVLAYHDRSDGGLFATLTEMAFAGHCGIDVDLGANARATAAVFSEELGAVLQVRGSDLSVVQSVLARHGLTNITRNIGRAIAEDRVRIRAGTAALIDEPRTTLHRAWSETSFKMTQLRDDPGCAEEQFDTATDPANPGLHAQLSFKLDDDVAAPYIARGTRPAVAVLREQGVNSHVEMAAVLYRAGFAPVDVHMTDVIARRARLSDFRGLIACGGFSYGDVLGAGEGWAKSILFHSQLRDVFAEFFARSDTFTLGVCNGCQMMAALKSIIPGTEQWPRFVRNRSEQFEARSSLVEIVKSPSVLLRGMEGSRMPIAVAHGEGYAEFSGVEHLAAFSRAGLTAVRFVDNSGKPTEKYPANPNGSPQGITGITTPDGRATLLMPHPERVFRTVQQSWHPDEWGEDSPWMRLFRNARVWVD
jgi:phosphoribosylformylglycinamidine synthase